MTDGDAPKLSLEEALRKLAKSRTVAGKGERWRSSGVRVAHRINGNEEFQEQPAAELAWGLMALIVFSLIDWFATKSL
jgi:hypothetical protein